ncbi:uncharacterized protein ZBIST_3097 [Zygosaccharomyces bailii]|nr:uncharacterized protein ZBIST_3097 [Zygosaccharomyces bailii]
MIFSVKKSNEKLNIYRAWQNEQVGSISHFNDKLQLNPCERCLRVAYTLSFLYIYSLLSKLVKTSFEQKSGGGAKLNIIDFSDNFQVYWCALKDKNFCLKCNSGFYINVTISRFKMLLLRISNEQKNI